VGGDYAGIVWQGSSHSAQQLDIDLGSDQAIDTIAIFGLVLTPLRPATLQVMAATEAQGQFTTTWWTGAALTLFAGTAMPVSGKGVALWSAPATAGPPAAVRYLRLMFDYGSSAAIEVARVVVGKRIELQRNFGYGAGFGVRDLGSLDFSARGVLMRRRAKKLRTVSLTFSNARKDEVEATVKPLLEQIGNTEMVALITDPAADAQRQNRCYFGPLLGDLSAVWRNAAAFETKINMVSIF
jgi:hypothetical protein